MTKTVAQLKEKEKCIYQAFAHLTKDTEAELGLFVNSKGYDADDTGAVVALAAKYGLTYIDALNGDDYVAGFAGLDANRELVAVITRDVGTVHKIKPVKSDPMNLTLYLGEARAREILEKSPDSVTWHAIYGATDGAGTVTWHDKQRLFPAGPTANAVAVCFSRKKLG
jgi:hypothetical protein